jgi:hypothetical protein
VRASQERPQDAEAQLLAALAAAAVDWEAAAQEALARSEYAEEGADSSAFAEVEERLAAGADAASAFLRDTFAPSILHERLTQPL